MVAVVVVVDQMFRGWFPHFPLLWSKDVVDSLCRLSRSETLVAVVDVVDSLSLSSVSLVASAMATLVASAMATLVPLCFFDVLGDPCSVTFLRCSRRS